MSRRLSVCLVLFVSLFLVGCAANPAVTSLVIIPSSATVTAGATVQFKASASYRKTNGTTYTNDVTSQVTWSSANTSVLTIDATGLAKAVSAGTTSVVATLKNGDQASTTSAGVTVNDATTVHQLLSIAVTPSNQTLTAVNQTAQFIAIGTFSSAPTTQDLTSQVQWTSSIAQVATINTPPASQAGLATAKGLGTTTITATYTTTTGATLVGTATLTVNAPPPPAARDLVSVSILPASQTLTSVNQTAKFYAVGTYTSAPVTALVPDAIWDSSVKEVATIDQTTGVATSKGPGTTAITATATSPVDRVTKFIGIGTLVQQATSVTGHELLGVTIIPSQQGVAHLGDTAQFIAVGTYSSAPLTDLIKSGITWASSAPQMASVDRSTGLATAVGPCAPVLTPCATITATVVDSVNNKTLVGQALFGQLDEPTQLPALTVIKLGPGATGATITSNPASVICGATCSATFPLGSNVTIIANTPPASWSNNCLNPQASNGASSADGLQCTVTMGNSTVVAAVFN